MDSESEAEAEFEAEAEVKVEAEAEAHKPPPQPHPRAHQPEGGEQPGHTSPNRSPKKQRTDVHRPYEHEVDAAEISDEVLDALPPEMAAEYRKGKELALRASKGRGSKRPESTLDSFFGT